MDCTNGYGHLCHDRVARAMLAHRNTPNQNTGMSPAEMLYGHAIRDHLPILREKYKIHRQWREIKELREKAMPKRHLMNQKQYNIHSRPLQELQVGEHVQVQNQDGTYPRRWMKAGRVVETLGNRQYRVRMDGSNRVTLRNCRFFRKIVPVIDALDYQTPQPPPRSLPVNDDPPYTAPESMEIDETECDERVVDHMEVDESQPTVVHVPPPVNRDLRRSTRVSRPPRSLSPQMRGPTHDFPSRQVTTSHTPCGHRRGGGM